jgi:CheY-like chemotaxis protein
LERNLSSDYKIYKAYDEEEGLKIARTSLPDMIVCDLLMPRINSFKFLQTLKKGQKVTTYQNNHIHDKDI